MRKRENSQKIILLLFVLFAVLTAGCKKKENAPPPQPPQQVKHETKPVSPVQKPRSSAQAPTVSSPSLDFSKQKDPFKPFMVETKQQVTPVFRRGPAYGVLPIQNYEVGQFRVLGIVTGLKQNSALIVDPAGKAYVVKAGMTIGKNGGRIERISVNAIEVLERYRDENGKIVKRIVKLTLPKKE